MPASGHQALSTLLAIVRALGWWSASRMSTGRGQGRAELGEAVRLVDPGADRVEQLHRAAKAAHRRGQVAQVAVGVAEAVPGVSLALAVTEVAQDGERGTAMAQGLLVVTEQRLTVARAVERPCLAGRVVGAAERLLRAEGVLQRLGVPPRVLVAEARKSEAGVRLAGVVTEYLEDLQRPVEVALGRLVLTEPLLRPGQAVVGARLRVPVAGPPGGRERGPLGLYLVVPVPVP